MLLYPIIKPEKQEHPLYPLYREVNEAGSGVATFDSFLNLYAVEGILRRLAQLPEISQFVLRGSLMTRQWLHPVERPAHDLDFLCIGFPKEKYLVELLQEAVCVDGVEDGLLFEAEIPDDAVYEICEYAKHSGLRILVAYQIADRKRSLQIDFSVGDTLNPLPEWIDYRCVLPEQLIRVQTVCPELQLAWKLHGLFEFEHWGRHHWRPKDLWDIYLMVQYLPLDLGTVWSSVQTAFAERETSLSLLQRLVHGDFAENGYYWTAFKEEFRDPKIPDRSRGIVRRVGNFVETLLDFVRQ